MMHVWIAKRGSIQHLLCCLTIFHAFFSASVFAKLQ